MTNKTIDTQQEYDDLVGNVSPIARIKELAENYNNNCYDIGCVLFHLKENDIYKTIEGNVYYSDKHTKWKSFCDDNLSISYRTAQYWLNLYRYFVAEMGISKDMLKNLGWSKAKEMIDMTDDPDTLSQFIVKAHDMTIGEVRASVLDYKEKRGKDTREVVKFKDFRFRLSEMQAEHTHEILKIASDQCKGDLNEGFFKIILEWFQLTHPMSEEYKNTMLVHEDMLDDNGQVLPEEIMQMF